MAGKYIVEAKAYDRKYGVVGIRKVFKGTQKDAYEKAMRFAYEKANKCKNAGVNFTITLQGKEWRTATKVNP